jgi:inorganic pyrophosphatase
MSSGWGDVDDERFWAMADAMVRAHRIVIDRPRGTAHPRYPAVVYPLDYGYLEGTSALDGDGIDCWVGTRRDGRLTGVIVTVDVVKQDTELKWLIGCTAEEIQAALDTHRTSQQAAMLVPRPGPA